MTDFCRLAGRVALITGGGGEIGSAIAKRMSREGAKIVVGDLDPAKSEATAKAICAEGGDAISVCIDVRLEDSAKAAVEATS